jgi:hypothetical protein
MGRFGTLVLNPAWITNGIYKIINWGNNNNKHVLTLLDGEKIFADEDLKRSYPPDKIQFLFKLMRVYELAFITDDEKLFAPLLLPVDRPDKLPEAPVKDRLRMVFTVEKALPPNIVSRLIVLRNKDIKSETELWRKGAVLHFRKVKAVARIIEDARTVEVIVTGRDRTAYIKSLRETLTKIFESYRELNPKLEYEVLIPNGLNEENLLKTSLNDNQPLMLVNKYIERLLQANRPFFDGQRDIPLHETGKAYALNHTVNINITGPMHITTTNVNGNLINNTFNMQDCVVHFQNLQGEMNNLASAFKKKGFNKEAEEITDITDALEKAESIRTDISNAKDAEAALRKKGIWSKLKNFGNQLADDNSALNTTARKINKGVEKLKSAARVYNDIAQLFPMLPKVPPFLLKSGESSEE